MTRVGDLAPRMMSWCCSLGEGDAPSILKPKTGATEPAIVLPAEVLSPASPPRDQRESENRDALFRSPCIDIEIYK